MKRMENFCDIKIDKIGVSGTCYTLGSEIYFKYNDDFFKVNDIMLENSIKCNIMKYFLEESKMDIFVSVYLEEQDFHLIEDKLSSICGWNGDYLSDYLVKSDFSYNTLFIEEDSILHLSRNYETGQIILTKIANSIEDFKRVYRR